MGEQSDMLPARGSVKQMQKAKRKIRIQHIAVTQRLLVAQTASVVVILVCVVCSCCRAILFYYAEGKHLNVAGLMTGV